MHFVHCLAVADDDFFVQPKFKVEYTLKVIGGSTGAVPGLGDMIEVDIQTKGSMMYILHIRLLRFILVPFLGLDAAVCHDLCFRI